MKKSDRHVIADRIYLNIFVRLDKLFCYLYDIVRAKTERLKQLAGRTGVSEFVVDTDLYLLCRTVLSKYVSNS